ncbi:MAG: hypothetical protein Q9171_005827 [Xanthocarpia ochracea]
MLHVAPYLLSFSTLLYTVVGAPQHDQATNGPSSVPGSIQCYRLASDFPPSSQWVSWQTLIDTSRPDMVGISNSGPDEADAAIAAVQAVSQSAGLDPRIVFAVMMQESSGKVRPIVGDYGKSYGLLQAQIPGIPLCDDYSKNECPEDVITSQIKFGVFGHDGNGSPVAPGLAYWMEAQAGDVSRSLRGYNTGSVPDPNDLTKAGAATVSYVSDVANRLTGALVGAKHQATCSLSSSIVLCCFFIVRYATNNFTLNTDYTFQGWMRLDPSAADGNMRWQSYEPKQWQETDVDIKITHTGIYASDIHTLRSGWAATVYPCCVGHEIVGQAVEVGSKVEGGIKVGVCVRVGAQSSSCLKPDCEECSNSVENHCQTSVNTYDDKYPGGSKSYGGYADYWRGPSHSGRTPPRSVNLLISTVSSPDMPLEQYLQLLRVHRTFIEVGAPEDKVPAFNAFALIANGVKIDGSAIGAPAEIRETLDLTVKKNVKAWINARPLKEANEAVVDMGANEARYRYVLVNENHAK